MLSKISPFLALIILTTACGKGIVNMDEQAYQPKIVIQGTLFPHQKVDNIRISRNFPLNTVIDENQILIRDAQAILFDEQGTAFRLNFNKDTGDYEYAADDLTIEYGGTYTLEVSATVDGQTLFARSTTTVPQAGFEILESKSKLDSMRFRQRDANLELERFAVTFSRSPGTDFYILSLAALDADVATFIYDNPFGEFDEEDVEKDLFDFQYNYTWIQDTPKYAGESTMEVFWFFTWFYGRYRAVVYAADKNLKEFLQTHEEVKEIDGNFHEPAFHFESDGIGVFGSAIADTVYFTVVK